MREDFSYKKEFCLLMDYLELVLSDFYEVYCMISLIELGIFFPTAAIGCRS